MIGRFIISLIFGGFVLSVVSIAWPRFTTVVRPGPLQSIQSAVKDTPFGHQLSDVLGVSDEGAVKPIDLQAEATQLKDWVIMQVQNKAEAIVAKQAADQISQRFNMLGDGQKNMLRQAICQPDASGSASQ